MKKIALTLLLLFFLSLFSCVVAPHRLFEIQEPFSRLYQRGYSFTPIREAGWFIGKREKWEMWLVKRGHRDDHTYSVQGVILNLIPYANKQEFVDKLDAALVSDYERCRFDITSHETRLHERKDALCAKSFFSMVDRKAVKRSTREGDMILDAMVLTCAHPKDTKICVNISYSERYYPGDRDPDFDSRAGQIFESLQFENL